MACDCTLRRSKGSPIDCRTLDVGTGGMCVSSKRPLATDEVLDFDLEARGEHVHGHARVLRQQRPDVYALRFEHLPEAELRRLEQVSGQAAR